MRGQMVHSSRRHERGQTLIITAVAMVSLLAMAVLAIDVVTLYVASGEAQRTADAAALAGAKAFVSSGFTSGQLGPIDSGTFQNFVCNGSTGFSDLQAQAAAAKNPISGAAATGVTTSCTLSSPENPQIIVAVTRTGLPTFFARIWGSSINSVSATSKAEAYNASGSTIPILLQNVKPWLIPNCDPKASTPPPCLNGSFFIDPNNNYALTNSPAPSFIGQYYTFTQTRNPRIGGYYAVGNLTEPTDCPSPSAQPAGSCGSLASSSYHDSIACSTSMQLSYNSPPLSVDANTDTVPMRTSTVEGTQCLIHTTAHGNFQNSCTLDTDPDCFVDSTTPISINGGASNTNPAMRVTNISRSDSIVTVPIFDYQNVGENPCPNPTPGQPCAISVPVIGFLQLGIQFVSPGGVIKGFVLNAVGMNPNGSAEVAVSGSGISPIPVRLVN